MIELHKLPFFNCYAGFSETSASRMAREVWDNDRELIKMVHRVLMCAENHLKSSLRRSVVLGNFFRQERLR
ncbi:MAG TPA: hypothetical protein VFA99_17025 [Acidobacteriaceae bacterium]|nr:hypothetical protein [Acidobacteriaceae bacterium]